MIAIITNDKRMNDFRRTRGKRYGGRDHAEALAALQDLKRRSGNELAVAPGPETNETLFHCLYLTESMLQQDPKHRPRVIDAAYILRCESSPDRHSWLDISDVPMCEPCKIWLEQNLTVYFRRLWPEYIGHCFARPGIIR